MNYLFLNVKYFVVCDNVYLKKKVFVVKFKFLILKLLIEILGNCEMFGVFFGFLKGNFFERLNLNNLFEFVELLIFVEINLF